jgi:hypothetical protein
MDGFRILKREGWFEKKLPNQDVKGFTTTWIFNLRYSFRGHGNRRNHMGVTFIRKMIEIFSTSLSLSNLNYTGNPDYAS